MHWTCFSVKKDRTIATARHTADWRVFPGINVANVKPLCKMWIRVNGGNQQHMKGVETVNAANHWLIRRSQVNGNKIYSFCCKSSQFIKQNS